MPMNLAGVGRFAIKPVNDSRIAQISGKMLIARRNSIVGRIKSQATARSDRPRTGTAVAGARKASPSAMPLALFVTDLTCPLVDLSSSPADRAAEDGLGEPSVTRSGGIFAFLLEHFHPVLDQRVERLLRRALVGDDVIVHAVLHVEEKGNVQRLRPEVLDHAHRLDKRRRVGRALLIGARVKPGLGPRSPAKIRPLLLNLRLREPLHIGQRIVDILRSRDDRKPLTAKLSEIASRTGWVLEEPDLV